MIQIIDIPDNMIKALEQGSFGAKYNMYDLVGCVMNGIPLDDIKADIEQSRYGLVNDGLDLALRIIDKHTKGDSEG